VRVNILERSSGEALGYVCHARDLSVGSLHVYAYELAGGVSWLEANPFVLNTLVQAAEESPDSLTFSLGLSHPLYDAFPDPPLYDLDRHGHYSFYVRVPDLPAFILRVAPVLEERLSDSVAAGRTATLELNFYSSGLRLEILHGRINSADLWNPTPENTVPDCSPGKGSPGKGDTQALLKVLFPKHPSNLQPVC
jgi:hypothetical protein